MARTPTVLFVCLHGAAKSVIAAHHLQRLADARGLSLTCSSAGLEPDKAVPPHVIDGLRGDGFDQPLSPPRALTSEILGGADIVVSLGCDLSSLGPTPATFVTWEGVPQVSDGFGAARDEITRRVQSLLDDLERRV